MSEERNDLPLGWEWAKISEIAQVNPRMEWPQGFEENTSISFVPMAALDEIAGAIVSAEERPIGEVWQGYKRFADGDVIFARITPCMENGKAAIAYQLINGIATGSTEFIVIRPTEGLIPEWIYHYIRQQSYRNEASRSMTGTAGQMRVPKEYMEDSPVPIAPTKEQYRVVEKIIALFEQSRTAREALHRVPSLIRQFRQSVLASAFRGDLAEQDPNDEPARVLLEQIGAHPHDGTGLPELPEGWCWTTLPSIGKLARGKSKHRPRDAAFLYGGPYPFIQTGDVRQANRTITSYSQTYSEAGLAQSHLWPSGTLCITIAANIADTAILGIDACFPDSVVGFLPESQACDIRFIEYFLRTAKDNLEQFAPATAQKNINLGTLERLATPLAPLPEQKRLADKVDTLFAFADSIEAVTGIAGRRVETLDQAILARAFRGELVPQDPDDEPASTLLERIRAERG